jgi:hypothetical protein
MQLEHLEPILREHATEIATIKAKLFNGMTSDLREIKIMLLALSADFAEYVKTREDTCPLNRRREKRTGSTARLFGIVAAAVAINTGIATLVLRLAGVF